MNFPETNKSKREPVPNHQESNIKILEEKLKQVDWRVFSRAYTYVLGYALLTTFSLIVVVGIANALVSLLK